MRRLLRESLLVLAATCAIGPPALIHFFTEEQVSFSSGFHFFAVGVSAAIATAASLALTIVGARRGDGRTVLIGTAFSVMAALLVVHGLASPGILIGMNGVIAFSGAATLPVGGALLALCTLGTLRRPGAVRPLIVLQVVLFVGVIVLGVYGMLRPSAVPQVPRADSTAALITLAVGLGFYGLIALRAIRTYLLTRRLADLMVVLGIGWLAAALVAALTLNYQELGWWLGHGLEVVGIATVGIPVALDLHRGAQSRPLIGDLSAAELVAQEEAFLGAQVRALMTRLHDKDEYTEEHTRRVALRAVQVGEKLGLPPGRLRRLAVGGLLHDMGKLSVPDAILKKPDALTDGELAVIRRHPEWGDKLLAELGFPTAVRRLVLDHHERLDGAGYPRGLTAAELDLETRILAVCDVYDALISTRVYREAWSHERAMVLLEEQAGTAFDARCVATLADLFAPSADVVPIASARPLGIARTAPAA
jgi:HD-GYP domain-containing protein (c-di-GMP phosphodiesterase class II)